MRLQFMHSNYDIAMRIAVMQTPQDRGPQPKLLMHRGIDVIHLGSVVIVGGEGWQPRLSIVIDHEDRCLERMPDNEPMLHLHGSFPTLAGVGVALSSVKPVFRRR
jgi:hypothetical protein